MDWRKWAIIFSIFFIGTCCVISVDEECEMTTGEGGKLGLYLCRTSTGGVSLCFFGLEGEFDL